jgi:hypothetical protein
MEGKKMNKAGFRGSHPTERTLISLCNNRMTDPTEVEDHIMLCTRCSDKVGQIAALIEALRLASLVVEGPKVMVVNSTKKISDTE